MRILGATVRALAVTLFSISGCSQPAPTPCTQPASPQEIEAARQLIEKYYLSIDFRSRYEDLFDGVRTVVATECDGKVSMGFYLPKEGWVGANLFVDVDLRTGEVFEHSSFD